MKQIRKIDLLLKSYSNTFGDYIRGYYRPLLGHLWVTRSCNLKCSYCYVTECGNKSMSLDTLDASANALWMLGVRIVSIVGGEPTLHPELGTIIQRLKSHGFLVHLSTNGVSMTDDHIFTMANSGLDVLDLSIDSVFNTTVSEKSIAKNESTLNRLVAACRKGLFQLKINTVLTSNNWQDVLSVINYCIERKIKVSVGIESNPFSCHSVDNYWSNPNKKYAASIYNACQHIITLKKAHPGVIVNPLKYFKNFQQNTGNNKIENWHCSTGTGMVQIDWDGYLFACSKLLLRSELSVHNVTKKNFTEMMRSFRERNLSTCNPNCYSSCSFSVDYFRKNPFAFLSQLKSFADA